MRLNKVQQLNFASFKNFICDNTVEKFNDINIFLGWNGSGKTTISRILRSLETGKPVVGATFRLDTNRGPITQSNTTHDLAGGIKVFNRDYVESVLRADEVIPHVVYIGAESIEYFQEEKELQRKKEQLDSIDCKPDHDQIAISAAKRVKDITGINTIARRLSAGSYGSYNKRHFEERIRDFKDKYKSEEISAQAIKSKHLLPQQKLDSIKEQIGNLRVSDGVDRRIKDTIVWIKDNQGSINLLLEKIPQQKLSQRIESLVENERDWVRKGVSIHFSDNSPHKTKCLFCDSAIKNQEELDLHFSLEVIELTNHLIKLKNNISGNLQKLKELQFTDNDQKADIRLLTDHLDLILKKIRKKEDSITTTLAPVPLFDFKVFKTKIDSGLPKTNRRQDLAEKVECHYVAEVVTEYLDKEKEYKTRKEQRQVLLPKIQKLKKKVVALRGKAQNTHQAAERLNDALKIAFPYNRLTIRDNDDGTGYELARDGNDCSLSTLSEGEHNLLALSYFLISLGDNRNRLDPEALIVIDDPVSSLDKNSIFQIFSQIVDEISESNNSRQYILMTHSLDFLGHLLEHYKFSKKVCFYNIYLDSSGSRIEDMPELIKKHKSDYYYMFYSLNQKLNDCSLEDGYMVANFLRRWLEAFLDFQFPSSGGFRSILEQAYKKARNSASDPPFTCQPGAMYRFLNHGSHSPDVNTVDESLLKNSKPMICEAFRLVQVLNPSHYEKLKNSTPD